MPSHLHQGNERVLPAEAGKVFHRVASQMGALEVERDILCEETDPPGRRAKDAGEEGEEEWTWAQAVDLGEDMPRETSWGTWDHMVKEGARHWD